MKTCLALVLAVLLFGCGGKTNPTPDAGYVADDSCGLDCTAQKAYGLVLNRCFEYSKTGAAADPADLGVFVRKVTPLEGDVKVIQVDYLEAGQIRMTDNFRFQNGDLLLARRTFQGGQRAQYLDASGNISGVKWAGLTTASGENATTSVTTSVLKAGTQMDEPTTYKVTATTPDAANELTTPLKTYESGVKLVFDEMPDHGADPRRVLVKDVGFVSFSTRFTLDNTALATFYRLQKIRDLSPQDGGGPECGFGSP